MIVSLAFLRTLVKTDLSDEVLAVKLDAIESMIRKYTNNNFQDRNFRACMNCGEDNLLIGYPPSLNPEDTIEISNSQFNNGLYVVKDVLETGIEVDKPLIEEEGVLVTKITYPSDVKMGVVNLIDWELNNRSKVGIKSESLSRYSVTYYDMDSNSEVGFPASMIGFLKPYKRARF